MAPYKMLYYYYYYFLRPTSTKLQAEILKLNNVNGCNDISFGDHSILEGDRIPPLKSHGQALEEELCFPGVLSDNSDAPANLLRHFYGCLMPCTCCLDGKRTENMGAGQTGIFVRLALSCSVSCCTCFDDCAARRMCLLLLRPRPWAYL